MLALGALLELDEELELLLELDEELELLLELDDELEEEPPPTTTPASPYALRTLATPFCAGMIAKLSK